MDNQQELFPVVDEEGRVIGSATRGECHNGSHLLHPVVHLHVFNTSGDIYLQKRPEWKDIQPGKWDTAVGGHIDYGETPEVALQREVREELGITDFTPEFICKYVFDGIRERELVYVHRTVFDGPIRPSAEELDGGRFWTMDEIHEAMGKNVLTPNFESEFKKCFSKSFKTMKTAIVQHVIRCNELEWNLQHITALLDQRPGADLYVLSETFATGFMAEGSAEQAGVQSPRILSWMQQQAHRLDAAIAGSVATVDGEGLLRNRLFFVRPDGSYDYYDKHHLFGFAGETDDYVPGQRRVIVEWRGVRFLLQVCYDLRFPVFSRNRGDYDAIIYVANWPQKRREVWQTLLKARALENQCFVAGVNIVGSDNVCEYLGDSVIINAYGRTIAACTPGMVEVASAELDMDELRRFRQKFPVLEDADEFGVETKKLL